MVIYKILRGPEWRALEAAGESAGAPVDIADGFVHFSTAEQVRETATKWFAGVEGLWLLACETENMGDNVRWEPSRGGALFPHLYASLRLAHVVQAMPLPLVDGGFGFPADIP